MADKKLNIKVRTQGAGKAKKDLKGVEGGMKSLGKAAAVASAAYFAAKGLISGLRTVIDLSAKQELAEKKLQAALGKTSKSLLSYASSLQKVTMFGDEATIEAMALMAAFTKDENALKKLTSATLDYAAATGTDLNAAAALVGRTFGTSMNAMSRYGVAVEGAAGSTERLDSLTGNLTDMFGGQALAQTNTMAGSIEQMKNAAGDAAEAIGDVLAPIVIGVAKALKGAAEWTESFVDGLNNLLKFGNVIGEIERDTKPLLEAQIAANKIIIDDLIILKMKKGELNEHEKESLEAAQHFLGIDQQKLAVLLSIEQMQTVEAERVERVKEVSAAYLEVQKKLADKAEEEKEARKKMAQFTSQTVISLGTSALMGDSVTESLKRAAIQLGLMVVQAKLLDFFMNASKGFTPGGFLSTAVSFLFGASPTQVAPSASAAAGSKIVINNNISGFGTIDSNFASNSLIPAINKAISTGQARLG